MDQLLLLGYKEMKKTPTGNIQCNLHNTLCISILLLKNGDQISYCEIVTPTMNHRVLIFVRKLSGIVFLLSLIHLHYLFENK